MTKLVKKTTCGKEEGHKGVKSRAGNQRKEKREEKQANKKGGRREGMRENTETQSSYGLKVLGKDLSPLSCFLFLLKPNGREGC